jgi:hypothetical protein
MYLIFWVGFGCLVSFRVCKIVVSCCSEEEEEDPGVYEEGLVRSKVFVEICTRKLIRPPLRSLMSAPILFCRFIWGVV